MNKINKLFAGFAAVAMLASCSNDEPTPGVTPETPEGDVAYMAITISSPENGSRSTEDGGYEASWSTEDEHKINTVDFYFFEEDGTYVFSASAGDNFVKNGTTGTENVEYVGAKNILILNGVRTNEYPEYVITVINRPSDFAPGATMQETADKLATYATKDAFVMTTSSFYGNVGVDGEEVSGTPAADAELRHDAKYFATRLNASDFKLTETDAMKEENAVEIYVERLDAKVQLTFGTETGKYEEYNNETYYKLSQTLAGGDNMTDIPNDNTASDVELYVKVVGWNLNATAKQSYMSKKLDAAWETTAPQTNWNWNVVNDWRSFWAQAYTYGIDGDSDESMLNYISAKNVATSKLGLKDNVEDKPNYTYCYENTNAPKNIFASVDGGSLLLGGDNVAVKNALVSHVVLHTQVYQKNEDGSFSQAGELVQYRGVLFTGESYKSLLLNRLKQAGKLNFWLLTGTETVEGATSSNWKTIDASFLTTSRDESEGHVLGQIAVNADKNVATDVYKYVEAVGVEGEDGYVAAHYEKNTNWVADLDAALAEVVDNDNPAVGSDNSADAFYYIPVEHHALKDETNAVEGYYGTVRNHWYKLTVSSFKKVGHLVFEPETDDTKVIPEGPEDPLYYVGAKINILSWKVVNQTITDL